MLEALPRAHSCSALICAPTLVTQCGGPTTMAKALLGHVGRPDPRIVNEMRRLQRRVRDLEAELARLQEEKDVLAAEASHGLLVVSREREPALTWSVGLTRRFEGRRQAASLFSLARLGVPGPRVSCGTAAASRPVVFAARQPYRV